MLDQLTTPPQHDVGVVRPKRIAGCLMILFGGLLSLFGVVFLIFGIYFFFFPSTGMDRGTALLGTSAFFTPSLMIGIPLFILGIWGLIRQEKQPPATMPPATIPSLLGQLDNTVAAERGKIRRRWGWILAILGWLCLVWGAFWGSWFLVNFVFDLRNRDQQLVGSAIFSLPGLLVGIILLLVGLWLIFKKTKANPTIPTLSI